jgi:hypothetical protein
MKIGITGTRNGMTDFQLDAVQQWLAAWPTPRGELHHGDCVGADAQVAAIAHHLLAYRTVCHPPVKNDLRAFFVSNETREPFSYFARNRNIVNETEILMVVPGLPKEEFHASVTGGTLYTYNYAKKQNKPRVLFYPNGEVIWKDPDN